MNSKHHIEEIGCSTCMHARTHKHAISVPKSTSTSVQLSVDFEFKGCFTFESSTGLVTLHRWQAEKQVAISKTLPTVWYTHFHMETHKQARSLLLIPQKSCWKEETLNLPCGLKHDHSSGSFVKITQTSYIWALLACSVTTLRDAGANLAHTPKTIQ